MNSDGASKEETMDFRVERSAGSPGFGFDLVIAGFLGQPHECVTFNPMPTPTIDRVNLKKDVRSTLKVIVLGYELKVKREAEVTDKVRSLRYFDIFDGHHRGLRYLSYRFPKLGWNCFELTFCCSRCVHPWRCRTFRTHLHLRRSSLH